MRDRIVYLSSIAALLITLAFVARECSSKDSELDIARQNIEALRDSTRKTVNELGKVQYERAVFAGDIETLKKLNSDLVAEVEAQKGKTRIITKIETKVVFDTIFIENRVRRVDDSSFVISFFYDKEFDPSNSIGFDGKLPAVVSLSNGNVSLLSSFTSISDLSINMKIYTGIKEDNGIYSIFARTDFPGVSFNLDGAIVDPEKSFVPKKQTPFSIMLGAGLGYGFTQSGTGVFPSVGIYVGLNLLNF